MDNPGPALPPKRMTDDEIDAALEVVQAVFRRFQPAVMAQAGKIGEGYTAKEDGTPVTDMDVEIEKALQAEMAQRFPGVLVFGEESGYSEDLPDECWLVDPIDGTKSFISGVPSFTSMAVLMRSGEAVASVIYNPTHDDMYVARQGHGAFKNGQRLDLGALPLPHTAFCKERFVTTLNELLKTHHVVCKEVPTGSGSGFSKVADGQAAARFDIYVRGHIHDYAPGTLLVREAGGVVVPFDTETYSYKTRCFVACHPALEATIRQALPQLRQLK